MSLAERQAKRTCHIDGRERERGMESWGERKLPENRVLWYYESTPSARFVVPFVGPAAAAAAAFLAKTKLAAAEKRW